jgi:Flp pilus assembly pilin Flp
MLREPFSRDAHAYRCRDVGHIFFLRQYDLRLIPREEEREEGEDARRLKKRDRGLPLTDVLLRLGRDDEGQDIAEYAVMLALILVLVVGTIRLVGTNANNAFSSVASSIQ